MVATAAIMARIRTVQIAMVLRLVIAVLYVLTFQTGFFVGQVFCRELSGAPVGVCSRKWRHRNLVNAYASERLYYKPPFAKRSALSNRRRGSVGSSQPPPGLFFGLGNAASAGLPGVANTERSLAGGRRFSAGNGEAKLPILLGSGGGADWFDQGSMQCLER